MDYPTLYYPTYHATPATVTLAKSLFYSGRLWYCHELVTDCNTWSNISVSIRTFEYGVHKSSMVNLCYFGGEILVPVVIPERKRMPVTFSKVCEVCRLSQCFCSSQRHDSRWPYWRQYGGHGQ